jgi:hypothetical protein
MSAIQTPALNALEAPDLSVSDYRSLREGKPVATVEQTPPAEAAMPTQETAAASETAETTEEQKQKKTGIDKRFSELTGEIRELKTQLAAKGTGPIEKTEKTVEVKPIVLPPDPADPEPDASKFTDYVEWQKSWNRWDRRQEQRVEAATKARDERAAATVAKASKWSDRIKAEKALTPDFEAIALDKDLPVSPVAGDAITESEIGTKILYYLGQNRAEAERIAKLSPVSQVREIGKIEAALEAEAKASAGTTAAEEPQEKKIPVSKAAAPHQPVRGAAVVSPSKNLEGMTQQEYREYRESGKIR